MKKINLKGSKQFDSSFLYEMKPYALLSLGMYAISYPVSAFMIFNGIILLVLSAFIMRERLKYRGYIS